MIKKGLILVELHLKFKMGYLSLSMNREYISEIHSNDLNMVNEHFSIITVINTLENGGVDLNMVKELCIMIMEIDSMVFGRITSRTENEFICELMEIDLSDYGRTVNGTENES